MRGAQTLIRRIAVGLVMAATLLTAADARQLSTGGWISDANGCRIWRQVPRAKLSVTWSGPCPHGFASGKGVLAWYDAGRLAGRYDGEMRRGHYHERGSFVWPSGERYWGEIRGDQRSGHGFFAWANGDRYDGEWKDGRRNGYGIYVWATGARYEGGWKDDRAEGEGTYREADGTSYKGRWVRGCLSEGERRAWVATGGAACE